MSACVSYNALNLSLSKCGSLPPGGRQVLNNFFKNFLYQGTVSEISLTKSTRFNTDAFEEYRYRLQTPIKLIALDFSLIIPNAFRYLIMEM
jgi:hypothetical protein